MTANPAENASFTAAFSVDQTPDEVFHAVTNVRGWWSDDIEGGTDKAGDEFTYRYRDAHRCRIKVTELVAGERVAWRVLDNYFDFTQDKGEWKDTEIYFEIAVQGGKTEIRFTHVGLVPEYECFDVCSNSWGFYLYASLRALIRTGRGCPPGPAGHRIGDGHHRRGASAGGRRPGRVPRHPRQQRGRLPVR